MILIVENGDKMVSKKFYRYTLIELMMVLVIVGILLGVGIGALNFTVRSGGMSGTLQNLSSQLSMARSKAVAMNRFVAVLLPDAKLPAAGITNDETSGFDTAEDRARLFTQSRICYVKLDNGKFKFVRWIENNPWVKWRKGVLVCASDNYDQVLDVNSENGKNSTAIVFTNSGTLTHDGITKIQLFRAIYHPDTSRLEYTTKAKIGHGWLVTVNPFTGRVNYGKLH